ncbi:MAG: ATPase [Deltaproteobacteria bacterium]|nr:ATPase [Deltaproteobacteria bacterium]MCL4874077.1 ATPase [bacterium]
MAELLVITGPGASLGFRCAGVDTLEVKEDADISGTLLDIQSAGKYGLVAIEERLLERVPELAMKRLRKKGLPIIMPISLPLKWGEAGAAESPVVRLIRRAIGYQIKIKR